MSGLNGQLNETEESLNLLHSNASVSDTVLDSLTDEVTQLELRIQESRQLVYNAKNANIQGEKRAQGVACVSLSLLMMIPVKFPNLAGIQTDINPLTCVSRCHGHHYSCAHAVFDGRGPRQHLHQ